MHKVVFSGNNGEIINGGKYGDLKVSHNGGKLTVESSATGGNATNQTTVTIATNGSESVFYIAILPVVFSKGITVTCFDANDQQLAIKYIKSAVSTISNNGAPKILSLGTAQSWIDNPSASIPEAVDLGLSVKWATFNIGANKPEEYGDYFAWGETEPKDSYKWSTYELGQSKNGPFSKYVLDSTYGTVDHKTVLDLSDDAAHINWGGDWRVPTKEEVAELMNTDNCSWTWATKNGVPGFKVTSRKSGFTANSIFLPANGMKNGTSLSDGGTMGNYWTSSVSTDYPYFAISPFFDSSNKDSGNCSRYIGLGVRPVQGAVVPVSSITILETLTLLVGKSETLTATIQPGNATYKNVTWTSSDESIATVDASGKVTSITPGTAMITAYSADGSVTATCVVSSNYQLAESVTLDKTELEMYVGDEPVSLKATILPETTKDKSVTWTSSNTSVAAVDEEGMVTAVANGTTTITATAKDGSGKSAACAVMVKTHVESVSLDKTEITLYNGKSTSLTATILPSTASNTSLTWASSDDNVATVSGSGTSATVNGISIGSATITATSVDGDFAASCVVTVKQYVQSISLDKSSIEMYVGNEPVSLNATIMPENASDKSVKWTSSKSSVATVDENGNVTAVAGGNATITATAKDGGGAKATCSVVVNDLMVDLGLTVKWAAYNLGATKPEEYGDYYAWGETEPKEHFQWSNYKFWRSGSGDVPEDYVFSKYNYYDNKEELDPEDDAAHVNWGGNWRMPTLSEVNALMSLTWQRTTINGVEGCKVIGWNGNWIFVPAGGHKFTRYQETIISGLGSWCCYWSSTWQSSWQVSAYSLHVEGSTPEKSYYNGRNEGLLIRPVCPKD